MFLLDHEFKKYLLIKIIWHKLSGFWKECLILIHNLEIQMFFWILKSRLRNFTKEIFINLFNSIPLKKEWNKLNKTFKNYRKKGKNCFK